MTVCSTKWRQDMPPEMERSRLVFKPLTCFSFPSFLLGPPGIQFRMIGDGGAPECLTGVRPGAPCRQDHFPPKSVHGGPISRRVGPWVPFSSDLRKKSRSVTSEQPCARPQSARQEQGSSMFLFAFRRKASASAFLISHLQLGDFSCVSRVDLGVSCIRGVAGTSNLED